MDTTFGTQDDLATQPAAAGYEGRDTAAARVATQERHPFSALPPGWLVIGRCRFGTGVPGQHASGCYALAHPDVGVALIDIAPNATPNAEARLRRALTASEFWPVFPGTLPVMHERIEATALRSLAWVLQRGFAPLPELTMPGGVAWIEGVQRAMAADSAWELPGRPKAAPDAPPFAAADDGAEAAAAPGTRSSAGRRRWKRWAALPVGFAATFAVGVVSGVALLDPPAPEAPVQVAAAPKPAAAPAAAPVAATAGTGAAPAPSAASAAGEAPRPAPEAAAPAPPPPAPQTAALPAADAPPPPPAPVQVAAVQQPAGPAESAGSAPPPSLETRLSHPAVPVAAALPMAPPRAPPARPVKVNATQQQPSARPVPVVDRVCSRALFRFQQGERLTPAELNFVRTGCATARR